MLFIKFLISWVLLLYFHGYVKFYTMADLQFYEKDYRKKLFFDNSKLLRRREDWKMQNIRLAAAAGLHWTNKELNRMEAR